MMPKSNAAPAIIDIETIVEIPQFLLTFIRYLSNFTILKML